MNIYLTSGTPEYMEQVRAKYPNEKMVVLYGEGNAVLLHETEGKTVFQSPRKFEAIDAINELQGTGYYVLNNIPVTEEGRPVFEHRFLSRKGSIENEPGFVAFRLMRPIDEETYIVLTEWTGPDSFKAWTESQAFKNSHAEKKPEAAAKPPVNIFAAASYVDRKSTRLNSSH